MHLTAWGDNQGARHWHVLQSMQCTAKQLLFISIQAEPTKTQFETPCFCNAQGARDHSPLNQSLKLGCWASHHCRYVPNDSAQFQGIPHSPFCTHSLWTVTDSTRQYQGKVQKLCTISFIHTHRGVDRRAVFFLCTLAWWRSLALTLPALVCLVVGNALACM